MLTLLWTMYVLATCTSTVIFWERDWKIKPVIFTSVVNWFMFAKLTVDFLFPLWIILIIYIFFGLCVISSISLRLKLDIRYRITDIMCFSTLFSMAVMLIVNYE